MDTLDSINKSFLGSRVKQKKTSDIVTIFAAINTIVGSVILLIPINWQDSGIIFSTIAMIVIGLISYKTCSWVVIVSKGQPDLKHIIMTYLGQKQYAIFVLTSSCLMFWVGIVYFFLLNDTLYQMLSAIFHYSNFTNFASKKVRTFNEFSIQWQAICIMAFLFPLFFVKKIEFIVKMGRIGAVSIYAYLLLIFYLFFNNIHQGNLTKEVVSEIKYFTPNVANILGNFAMAFSVHNSITETMSNNKKPENNPRNTKIVFLVVCLIYSTIGIMGTFALQGRYTSVEHPQIIYDYFVEDPGNVPMLIVASVFFIHLVTVYPFFCFIAKTQLATIIFRNIEEPVWYKPLFNVIFGVTSLIMVIFQVDINIVIGLIGTLFGFMVVYYTPIQLRMNQEKILQGEAQLREIDVIEKQDNSVKQNLIQGKSESENETGLESKNYQQSYQQKPLPKQVLALIICFYVFGAGLAIVSLLQLFKVI